MILAMVPRVKSPWVLSSLSRVHPRWSRTPLVIVKAKDNPVVPLIHGHNSVS